MSHFIYNGKLLLDGTSIVGPANRGLRYGDGLFETIKYKNGQLIFVDEHLSRLWKGMQVLQFKLPKHFTPDKLQEDILLLLSKNKHTQARIRVEVIRGEGGLYDTNSHAPQYIIQTFSLNNTGTLNENGLQLCIYEAAKKSIDIFSNLKHNNFLPYFMAAQYAQSIQCNDAILLNTSGRVADTSIANIFMVKDDVIFTPSLQEGCVAGVMRKFLIQQLATIGYSIREMAIDVQTLLDSDEVFLTNSIYNMKWVACIDAKNYDHIHTKKIFNILHQTNPSVFC